MERNIYSLLKKNYQGFIKGKIYIYITFCFGSKEYSPCTYMNKQINK
jgi:hypothetical protein